MSTINKIKIRTLPNVLKREFGLEKEGEVEMEIDNHIVILKPISSTKGKKPVKNTADALLKITQSLPEPEKQEEMTDYSSNINKYLYKDPLK
ncbi:MAG: hypothetical protein HZA78_01465 [Candidatus Schekmanbacteria bacterium]|nr:hypothetical protein [Candidatus Schekmanbacteria bacterium]